MANLFEEYKSKHVTISMAVAFWERFDRASDEILKEDRKQREEIEELEKACEEFQEENKNLREICSEFQEKYNVLQIESEKLKEELIKWHDQQNGKGKRPNKKMYSRFEEVAQLTQEGKSNREIAEIMGSSDGTIRRIKKMYGIGTKPCRT